MLNKESIAATWTGRSFLQGSRRSPDFAPVQAYGLGWGIDAYKVYSLYGHSKCTRVRLYRSRVYLAYRLFLLIPKNPLLIYDLCVHLFFSFCEQINGLINGYKSSVYVIPDLYLVVSVMATCTRQTLPDVYHTTSSMNSWTYPVLGIGSSKRPSLTPRHSTP